MVAWSPDGALLASGSEDYSVRIWDPHAGVLLATRDQGAIVMQVSWSRDGERLLTAGFSNGARIWSVARDGRSVAEIVELARRYSPWRLEAGRLLRDPQ